MIWSGLRRSRCRSARAHLTSRCLCTKTAFRCARHRCARWARHQEGLRAAGRRLPRCREGSARPRRWHRDPGLRHLQSAAPQGPHSPQPAGRERRLRSRPAMCRCSNRRGFSAAGWAEALACPGRRSPWRPFTSRDLAAGATMRLAVSTAPRRGVPRQPLGYTRGMRNILRPNHGRKPRKFIQDCTIRPSCR